MEQQFTSYKTQLIKFLSEYLSKEATVNSRFGLDTELFHKLIEMTISGKMYRGIILLFICQLFSEKNHPKTSPDCLIAAAALELFQTGILIQDDVMDQGEKRRGLTTIHRHFSNRYSNLAEIERNRLGESLAICMGDISYFLGFELLSRLSSYDKVSALTSLFAKEMVLLGLAQADDVLLTNSQKVSLDQIIAMYAGKTSRYTYILPISAALLLCEKSDKLYASLEEIGTAAGIVYQLLDDKLGIFGDDSSIGKSTSSDITEGKKTVYWYHAINNLDQTDLELFRQFYGNKAITFDKVETVRNLMRKCKADAYVDSLIQQYEKTISDKVHLLPVNNSQKSALENIIRYINSRTS